MRLKTTLVGMLITLCAGIPSVVKAATHIDSTYATKMIECLPAPGQFVGSLTVPDETYCVGENGSMVSLGGFGGYIILEFAKPIVNDPHNPYGVDFTIQGNSFIGNLYGVWTEPGAVMVMKDENHNGIPDDTWYELAGSDYYLSTTKKNVSITYYNPHYRDRRTIAYSMSDGTVGGMRTNQFHQQSYFPGDYDFNCDRDSITYTGNLIQGCVDLSTPNYIENYRAQLFGYCDNKGAEPNKVYNPYSTSMIQGCDGFDLDWAVDKDGNYVQLDTIHWIKIYTSLNQDGGWLGEYSTEVVWAQRVTPDPNYVHRNYYAHYIGIPQLKAVVGHPIQYEGLLFKNGRPCNEGTPQWSLSTDSCGTIDQTGKFTPTHCGDVFVRFTQLAKCDDKDTIVVALDSVRLRVVEMNEVVLEMEGFSSMASNDQTTLTIGEYAYISAQGVDNIGDYLNGSKSNRYSYDTYTWTSSDPSVGTLQNGLFHAAKVGRTMIHAYSNTNPKLCDSILVIVKEPVNVKITVKNDSIVQNHWTPKALYGIYDLFDAGKVSLYMKSATSVNNKANVKWLDDKQRLSVEFAKNDFGRDTVAIVLRALDKEYNFKLPFIYSSESDMEPVDKKMLFVNGGVFGGTTKTALMAYNPTDKQTTTIGSVEATSVQDMIVDGAYAYVAADDYITRFDLTTNEVVASKYCQDITRWDDGKGKSGVGLNNKMAVYRNWLLVTRQTLGEDGHNVRIYNKTDLSLVTKIAVSNEATDIAIVDTKAYVMINGGYMGTTSSMAVIDLQTLTLEKEVPMNTAGLNVSMMIPKDSIIYCVRRDNNVMSSAVLAFNTRTQTFTETATNLPADYSSAPAAIDPMTGDSLMLATKTGFRAYNTKTGVTSATEVMTTPTIGLAPMASTRDTETGEYYVAYGAWGGNGEGRIYNADFTPAGTFTGVTASPEAMAMCPKVERNDRPKPKAGKGVTSKYNIEEYNTNANNYYILKDDFTDTENNIDHVYLKNWARYTDWLTYDRKDSARVKGSFKFPESLKNNLGQDSIVHIYAEVIDSCGANYAYEAYTITFRPALYAIYARPIADVVVQEGADDMPISLADAFTWKAPNDKSKAKFVKTVKENTNEELVTTILEGDQLTLSFAEGKTGMADITIEQTGTYQQNSSAPVYSKSATNTFRVIVQDTPSGINDVNAENSLVAYPNPFVDYLNVNLTEPGTIRIYDLSGKCVAIVIGHAGVNTIPTSTWTEGVYIIKCNNLTAKVVK